MYQILFKHLVYEYCINLAFDNFRKNFPSTVAKFNVGDMFSVLEFEIDDTWWGMEDVEVVFCENGLVMFSYKTAEVHIPYDHPELGHYKSHSVWESVGSYGEDINDVNYMFSTDGSATHIFSIEEIRNLDYA